MGCHEDVSRVEVLGDFTETGVENPEIRNLKPET
jgi:hypothetical protein